MDLNGKVSVLKEMHFGLNKISLIELSKGIYFYKITEKTDRSKSGKIAILE